MKKTLLTSIAILGLVSCQSPARFAEAHATEPKIYYPYKKDGAHRDWFLQSGIAKCVKGYQDSGLGSQQEILAFCECKFLTMADTLTGEDEAWYYENHKVSAQFLEKKDQAENSCKHHFSKLPKIPERKKQ